MKTTLFLIWACICIGSTAHSQTIKVALASTSEIKFHATVQAFQCHFEDSQVEVAAYPTPSLIPEQPIGYQAALRGAKNRLLGLAEEVVAQSDYLVSMENYIEFSKKSGQWEDRGLVIIKSLGRTSAEVTSLSPSTVIPSYIVEQALEMSRSNAITEDGIPVTIGQAIQQLYGERMIDSNDWHREAEFGGVSRQDLLQDAVFKALHSEEIQGLKEKIRYLANFPKEGVRFADFTPILSDGQAFNTCMDLFAERYRSKEIDVIVGLESRGFIMGAALAIKLGIGFIPVRKPGKLPGPVYTLSYEKEYGYDSLSISQTAIQAGQRVLVIDDLIATGGSACAAIELVRLAGGEPVEFATVLKVRELRGKDNVDVPCFNLIDE